jgi:hypothetical protein
MACRGRNVECKKRIVVIDERGRKRVIPGGYTGSIRRLAEEVGRTGESRVVRRKRLHEYGKEGGGLGLLQPDTRETQKAGRM